MIDISIIVVLYNEFAMARECLRQIEKQTKGRLRIEVLVIANCEEGEEYKGLRNEFTDITFVRNKKNIGYGPAVNVGLKKTKGKYIVSITPDSRLLPDTLEKTHVFLEQHEDTALVSCRIFSLSGKLELSAGKAFPSILSNLFEYNMIFYKIVKKINKDFHPLFYSLKEHKNVLPVKHVIGAYMLIRRNAAKRIGFNDPQFFLYREETDFCKRLYDDGYKLFYLPIGGVLHIGDAPWKKTRMTQCTPYYMKSNYLFFKKHYGKTYAIVAWVTGLLSTGISIPFLASVALFKSVQGKASQSKVLLPVWVDAFSWHLFNCWEVIF